jgi:hypothetical protein
MERRSEEDFRKKVLLEPTASVRSFLNFHRVNCPYLPGDGPATVFDGLFAHF